MQAGIFNKSIIGMARMAAILCIPLMVSGPVHAERFHIGYFQVKPHAMPGPHAKPEGVAVEYFDLIAEKMGLSDIQYSMFPLKRLLRAFEQHTIDMVLLFAKNSERAAAFVYPESPFCLTQPSIAVNVSHHLKKVDSVASLLSLTIQESADAYRSPFVCDPRLKIEPLHGDIYIDRCFAKLIAERIDACYQPDHYPIHFEANRDIYASRIRVIPLPEPPIGLYSVFSKQSAKKYLERYETALEQVKQASSYEEIFEKFMDKSNLSD